MKIINPHEKKAKCDKLVKKGLIWGPFEIIKKNALWIPIKCDYK